MPVLNSDQAVLGELEGINLDFSGLGVLVIDRRGNYETCLMIEALANRGANLTIATPFATFGANTGFTHLKYYRAQIPKWRARVMTMTSLTGIDEGIARLSSALEPDPIEAPCDLCLLYTSPSPRD